MRKFPKEADLLIRMSLWSLVVAVAMFAIMPPQLMQASELFDVATLLVYLVLSVGITAWVARSLEPAWRPFLRRRFDADDELAPAIANTLSTMYILFGCGLATLMLPRGGATPARGTRFLELLEVAQNTGIAFVQSPDVDGPIEMLASGLGRVLLVLGFLSLWITRYCMRQEVRVLFDGDLTLPDPPPMPIRNPAQMTPETKRGGQPLAW